MTLDELIKSKGFMISFVQKQLGLKKWNFWNKKKDPENSFTIAELRKIAEIIGVEETAVFEAVKFSSKGTQKQNKNL
ncbi:hypothetical protein [Lactococcus lactis]|uniref:hypothetical protein n=1 Tax=Lactococcus lactis TaxID=1358 RepID=UPI00071E244A|nr:hypothetical protein [Lactococcus lactis]KST86540.1 hypothetical protein LK337_0165 [Lactococcus lactis subsp. lactis]